MSEKTRKRVVDWAIFAGMFALAALVAVLLIMLRLESARVDALYAGLETEQEAAKDRGDEPAAPKPEDLVDDPGQDTESKDDAISESEIRDLVEQAVADYLSKIDLDKDDEITEADIVAAVSNYLSKHGVETFGDELARLVGDEVERQLSERDLVGPKGDKGDPGEPGEPGKDGEPGEAGPAPTPEQIGDAVEAYFSEIEFPLCPGGYEAQVLDVLTTTGVVESIICVNT